MKPNKDKKYFVKGAKTSRGAKNKISSCKGFSQAETEHIAKPLNTS